MNAPADTPTRTTTTRHDGWTPDRRRNFLELVAEGHSIETACAHVGMSKVTAYALRRRDSGFALAWSGAVAEARETIADILTSRALVGQVDISTRADGSIITRHRFDNRLGLALLARLDRLAARPCPSQLGDPDEAAMRAAARALDALVDRVGLGDLDADAVAAFIEPQIGKLRALCRSDGSACGDEETEQTCDDDAAEADGNAEDCALSPVRAVCAEPAGTAEKQPHLRELRKLRTAALTHADPAHADAGTAGKQPHLREVRKLGTGHPVHDRADDPALAA